MAHSQHETCSLQHQCTTRSTFQTNPNSVAPSTDKLEVDNEVNDVFLKAIITTSHPLEEHLRNSRFDKTLLVLRHPFHNYKSLLRKHYADQEGSLEGKFATLERLFKNRDQFDEVVLYEDFALHPQIAVEQLRRIHPDICESFFDFPRSPDLVIAFNRTHSDWCDRYYQAK